MDSDYDSERFSPTQSGERKGVLATFGSADLLRRYSDTCDKLQIVAAISPRGQTVSFIFYYNRSSGKYGSAAIHEFRKKSQRGKVDESFKSEMSESELAKYLADNGFFCFSTKPLSQALAELEEIESRFATK